ncbi:divergent polysaccharide deacetylase family protein, partial [Planktotalea sp.]|uniref:divergent polysaccharide deacetylase family protein n=1 Tax=Planktotalea sp. TaxID=2029877 RepID=UPI00329860C1
ISLQGSRELTDQITKIVQESGHGLVLQANGLNTAQKLASREGVPAATIFRDFDGKDQKAGVIRRFLDQAAFKAGQEGGVIMLGRLRAETISALLIWGLADRASRVALVPVSAVLQQDAAN